MAVLMGGGTTARVAYNQADDNSADRLLALQDQVGAAETLVPSDGTILETRLGSEIIDIDVGLNVYADGQTYGTNQLTSVSAPFTRAMVGLSITIFGHGRRVITALAGAGDITFSGPAIAAQTGLRFTRPVGLSAFDDGAVSGNTLTSVSAPFLATMVGRNVNIQDVGSREIVTFTSTSSVDFEGPAVSPALADRRFTVPVFIEEEDRLLSAAGGQIVDAHRTPALNTATVVRWRLGERRRRGSQRTVV